MSAMLQRKFTDQELYRRNKLKKITDEGKSPFLVQKFLRNFNSSTFKKEFDKYSKEELHENKTLVILAGRVMAIRQTFGVIKDFFGKAQIYVNKKEVNEKVWETFSKDLDIGDIIGVEGTPMKTNTGEVTLKVQSLTILSKSLKPLPEKFHGLQDVEERIRHRYVDLITNEESMNTFVTRSKIVSELRRFMDGNGFIEVETPILQSVWGGANAKPFFTKHNVLDKNFFLRVATELSLKKIMVGGFEKVYEIGRNFRNEGMDTTHNPEFTTMEAYEAYVSVEEMMDLVENIFRNWAIKLDRQKINYKNVEIDFSKPFRRVNMLDFIKEETMVDFNKIETVEEALKLAKQHNIIVLEHQKTKGHIINLFFEEYCEKKCLQPTIVYGHPVEVSPLAKKNKSNPNYTDRFELFICQKEYANAFSELNDPIDQLSRFEQQVKEREKGNDEANEIDYDYVEALEYGLPPTGGIGIGIDRVAMLFTNSESISDVLFFPHTR